MPSQTKIILDKRANAFCFEPLASQTVHNWHAIAETEMLPEAIERVLVDEGRALSVLKVSLVREDDTQEHWAVTYHANH